jgi:hypothetical protein
MQTINAILRWPYLPLIAIIWVVIDLAWIERWRGLITRMSKLFAAPWIFEKDTKPQEHPFYPRKFMEQLAMNNITTGRADSGTGDNIGNWWKSLSARVLGNESPLVSIGHILSLIFFLFFIYADAVTVANTLVLIGVEGNLPVILQRLDLAILGGALVSATVGIWILIEMFGKGEFLATGKMSRGQRTVYIVLSILVTLFSVLVMLALAGQRMISLGVYASSPAMDFAISFTLYGLLAINSSFAAAITFTSAAMGIIVIIVLLALVLAVVLPALVFLFDLIWRGVIIVMDALIWLLFTPPMAIPYGIGRLVGLIKPSQQQ